MTTEDKCDVDGGTNNVEKVTINWRGKSFVVDLCENETKIIEAWEAAGSTSPRGKSTTGPNKAGHKVVPID